LDNKNPFDGDQGPQWRENFDPQTLIGWEVADKYKILRHLGGGGFGEVYEAFNVNLIVQRVVVKFLKQVRSRDRFEKEAKILCQLDHPNICRIIDFLPDESALVMQFIDGRDFDVILEETGPPTEEIILKVARSVCAATAYAHTRRIAHRDIKPKNIMTTLPVCFRTSLTGISYPIQRDQRTNPDNA